MMDEPKYIQIKTDLQNKIKEEKFLLGARIPSETDLQKEYKVSRHTVRLAINHLVNEGYVKKIQGSGTYVSNAYQSKKMYSNLNGQKTIAVVTTYLSDYIFPSIIRGIEDQLSEYGYSLLLYSTKNKVENERNALESMLENKVDGLIIEPTKSNQMNPNLNYYLDLHDNQVPLIMLHAGYEELDLPIISMDDVEAGRIATEYLIEKGHLNIGMITKSDDLQGRNRFRGFLKALYDAKLSFSSHSILRFDTESKANLPILIREMLTKGDLPSAFVSYNDEVAVVLIEELKKIGLNCPDDISIVSHDNSYFSDTLSAVKLTTINHPKEKMGKKAAELVISSIENRQPIQSYVFKPELVIRDSVLDLENEEE